ncbi:tape measure protein [Desulfovibrio desulfuricans]|uniref:tape measure protein n=1 Tax=Desulfovibrio desulfuricans TaxID=876 RepID=UPI001785397D|nr:tape measure protein [Desulfovibrio desulfuricans]MBD8894777.1 tape measure protein [Desulfovibrio desulfuricans]
MAEKQVKVEISAIDKASQVFRALGRTADDLKKKLSVMTGALTLGVGVGSVIHAVDALTDSMLSLSRLKISYESIFGSEYAASRQLDFVYRQTQQIGLQFQSSAEAAKTFFAASQGTPLERDMNSIFSGIANAAAAMQMPMEDVNGVFLALGQMVSKGKVQAEELRGQLGERLPGAFRMAAEAMGMSTAELDKFMADGKLLSEDLLPRLAEALNEKYAESARRSAEGLQGSINTMTTEWERFKANVLNSEITGSLIINLKTVLKNQNDNAAQDKERNDLIAQLQGMGIGPDSQGESVDFMGNTYDRGYYSDQFLNFWRTLNAGWAAENAIAEQNANAQQAIFQKADTSFKNFVKDSKSVKISALTSDKDSTLKDIDAAIEERRSAGVGFEDLIKRKSQVVAEYQNKLEKLNKSESSSTNKRFSFDTGLERLRREVANMESTVNPAAIGIDRIRQKLELEKQNAIAAAEAHAKLSVQRKEASPQDAQEKLNLEKRKAELTYAQKLADAEEKGRQQRLEFYREFAELSGNFTLGIDAQTEAIRRQGEEYKNAGISAELVQQYEAMKRLETARDPLSGSIRSLRQYASEATDLGKGMADVWATCFQGMEQAGTNAFMGMKVSATDWANSFIADLFRISYRAAVLGPLASGLSSLFSGLSFGSGLQTTNPSSSWANFGATPGQSMSIPGFHNGGLVGVDAPTFTRSVPAAAFIGAPRLHTGGGWFGPGEYAAILKKRELVLNEQEARAYLSGRSAPPAIINMIGAGTQAQGQQIVINFYDKEGNRQQQTATNNGFGNMTLDVLLNEFDKGLAQRITQGKSQSARAYDTTRGISSARQKYN